MQAALFGSLEAYQEGMGIKQGLTIQSAILKKKRLNTNFSVNSVVNKA